MPTYRGIAMDIMDRRAARDLEFGRRMLPAQGRDNFTTAINARRVILKYQLGDSDFKDELFRSRNNLAYALQEASRRTDGEEGDKQIEEAVTLLEEAVATLDADARGDATGTSRAQTSRRHWASARRASRA